MNSNINFPPPHPKVVKKKRHENNQFALTDTSITLPIRCKDAKYLNEIRVGHFLLSNKSLNLFFKKSLKK